MAPEPGVRDPGTPTTNRDVVPWLGGRFNFLSVMWARARARGGPVKCYRCGQPGHTRKNCPLNRQGSDPQPARELPPPVPPRRPPMDIADAEAHAAAIRESMGWTRGVGDRTRPDQRELALAQVAESRHAREIGGL